MYLRELLCLFESVLTGTAVKHEQHFVWCFGQHLLHNILYLLQLVHQAHLVMQTSCGVDDYDVGAISLSRRQGVESYRGRVGTHLLLHNGHTYALAPDANLLYGSGTEGVGSSQNNLLSSLLNW